MYDTLWVFTEQPAGKIESPNSEYRNNSHKNHKIKLSYIRILKKENDGKTEKSDFIYDSKSNEILK